jgi:hypothetical protein
VYEFGERICQVPRIASHIIDKKDQEQAKLYPPPLFPRNQEN